jgi:hypothetical protein
MSKGTYRRLLATAIVASLAVTGVARADDGNTLDSQLEERTSAASIDFAGELGLQFPTLTTLGARIEQARQAGDPVGLMAAATELRVAEGVSEEQASLTAETLTEEAVELAQMRGASVELKAVAMLVDDEATTESLQEAIAAAEEREEEIKDAQEDGEQSRYLVGDLIINNHTHFWLDIHVNGFYTGLVAPHAHQHFHVHSHYSETVINANARGGGNAHRHIHSHGDYVWNISY